MTCQTNGRMRSRGREQAKSELAFGRATFVSRAARISALHDQNINSADKR